MISSFAFKLCRTRSIVVPAARLFSISHLYLHPSSSSSLPPPFRLLHSGTDGPNASSVSVQMINYALSHARSQKSEESYAQGVLVLEQCLSTQSSEGQDADDSKGLVLLAMSTLFYERGNTDEAIEKLLRIQGLTNSSPSIRVAAMEALAGLHLELGQDDTSSVIADKCLELLESNESKAADENLGGLKARAKAVKGLVELVSGNFDAAESLFSGFPDTRECAGSAALSYGEYLHAAQNFSSAKEVYQKVIDGGSEEKDSSNPFALAACSMSREEVLLAATCALGQIELHLGNFADAEEILTRALTKTEETFSSCHPKVGVVLTCIALMFRHKAMQEHSSSLLIQEGLYRKAMEMLKAPSLEIEGEEAKVDRSDIVALARGGYAEILCIQQNRKDQGEKMKSWAVRSWRNRRISLADALDITTPPSKVPVIDTRISRTL